MKFDYLSIKQTTKPSQKDPDDISFSDLYSSKSKTSQKSTQSKLVMSAKKGVNTNNMPFSDLYSSEPTQSKLIMSAKIIARHDEKYKNWRPI